MYDPETLRKNIRDRMTALCVGVTSAAKVAGISQGNLSDFLNAKRASLKVDTLDALAGVFKCTVGELLGEEAPAAAGDIRLLSFNQIIEGDNPRKTFDEADILSLAEDIGERGILQNLIVTQDPAGDDTYMLVAGERRWRAITKLVIGNAWSASDPTIPAKIVDGADAAQLLMTSLVENAQRVDVPPVEEAQAFKRLIDEHGWETGEIAREMGCDIRHVQYRLKLLDLGAKARGWMGQGIFGPAAGRHIARLGEEGQAAILHDIEINDLVPHEKRIKTRVEAMLSVKQGTDKAAAEAGQPDIPGTESETAGDTDEMTDAMVAHHGDATEMAPPGMTGQEKNTIHIDLDGRDDAWIEAQRDEDGPWLGKFCSPFGLSETPMDWPTPESAIGAAARLLASDMREISLNNDISSPERTEARKVMDWANDTGAQYGAARVTLPGDPQPDCTEEQAAAFLEEFDAEHTAAGEKPLSPHPEEGAARLEGDGRGQGEGDTAQAVADYPDPSFTPPLPEDRLAKHKEISPPPSNAGLTPHEWTMAMPLLRIARRACVGDRVGSAHYESHRHTIELAFASQTDADSFVDAFEALFPPGDADEQGD